MMALIFGSAGIDLPTDSHLLGARVQAQRQPQRPELRTIRTVVIDPGHGGNNNGTRGATGSQEKDLTLAVAYAVRDELRREHPNLKVILTRNIDVDLSLPQRIHTAHAAEADLFLSLHMNASTNLTANGLEVFYLRADKSMPLVSPGEGTWGRGYVEPDPEAVAAGPSHQPDERELASILADLTLTRAHQDSAVLARTLLDELKRSCPRCRSRGVRQDNFGVLRGCRVPAVVVEFGFLSHNREEKYLVTREAHMRFARAIMRTIERMDYHFVQSER